MKLTKQERMLVFIGLLVVAGIFFFASMSCFIQAVSHWGGERKVQETTEQTRRALESYTPRPITPPSPTTTPRLSTPTIEASLETILEILEGCGGLSEYEQQKIYWSVVVAQDKAEEQAERQNTRPDYALADLAVMAYFSITANTLECIEKKGNKEMWPIPSTP